MFFEPEIEQFRLPAASRGAYSPIVIDLFLKNFFDTMPCHDLPKIDRKLR
jgi:hypothetical protein